MPVIALTKQNYAFATVVSAVAVVLFMDVIILALGTRPYGEQAILQQIDHEDSALCKKLGFTTGTLQSADCMIALADLRRRHVDLLTSHSWL